MKYRRTSKILVSVFAVVFSTSAVAQETAKRTAAAPATVQSESPVQDNGWPFAGLPVDWSFSHVIHTARNPNSQTEHARNDPRAYYQWLLQGHKAGLAQASVSPVAQSSATLATGAAPARARAHKPNKPHRDWSLSLGSGTVAQNMFPAKFNFYINNTPDCTNEFVVYGLNVASGASRANLVGVNNLYSGSGGICGTAPTVYWAYQASTAGGKITTSPVLYTTGQEVAFIESTGAASILHVLRWKANNGTVTAPVAPTAATNAATCTAPCMVSLTYDSSHGTTLSSPFYNYSGASDTLYVGNDNGKLFQITGIFTGTPTVSNSNGWLATGVTVAAAGIKMTGPILDTNSGNIFIGGSDGKLYSVSSSTGAVNGSIAVGSGNANGGGIVDSPIIDSSNGTVLSYAAANAANVGATTANTIAVVVQATTALGSPKVATIGEGSLGATTNLNVVSGSFDNAYFNWSGSGVNPGHFYAIGTTATVTSPTLYQLGYSGVASVTLNTNGAGYTTPAVSFSDATGSGATATASGGVTGVTLTAAGSGYTAMPTASFSAPPSGTTASGSTVTVAVTGVTVSSGGSGYTSVPSVTFAGTGSPNATATAALGVGSLNLTAAGAGYTSVPTISFSGTPTTAANATATLSVQSVNVTGNGAGYTSVPTVTISGGGGTGATASATVGVSSIALKNNVGASGTVSFSAEPTAGDTITIGSITYVWRSSANCSGVADCVVRSSTTSTDATNLANAINGSCGGTACSPNPSATATASSNITTVTNTTASAITFTKSSSAYTLNPGTGTIPAPSNGSAGCTNGSAEPLTFTGTGGSGAAGTANVSGGVVQSVTLTAGGSGFTVMPSFTAPGCTTQPSQTVTAKVTGVSVSANGNNFTSVPSVGFSTSGATTAAAATAVLGVQTLTVNTPGTGYTSVPSVSMTGGTTNATATASLSVVSLAVGTAGSYTTFPTASVTGNATLSTTVDVVGLTAPSTAGSGYTSAPTVTFSGGGSGATATSTINVTNVALTYGGGGYTSPTVTISGGATNATATATVNPGAVLTPGTSPTTVVVDGTAGVQASPVTEIFTNASTDLLFYGDGIVGGPSNLTAENVTTATSLSPENGIAEPYGTAGTSGIVVDNISTEAQASSIYFATQATSNNCGTGVFCAVKLTQAGLQ